MAAMAGSGAQFASGGNQITSDPEWKRKKCKSCKSFSSCRVNPNQQACSEYKKRK